MSEPCVQSLPLHRPVVMSRESTLKQAALAMDHNNIGSVLVSDSEGRICGIITDRDLALATLVKGLNSSDMVHEMNLKPVIGVQETAGLSELIRVMKANGIRRVPVFREIEEPRGGCIGVITLDDLIKAKLIDVDDEAEILKVQLHLPRNLASRRVRKIFQKTDHQRQSYSDLIHHIQKRVGLARPDAEQFVRQVLGTTLRRVPIEGARKFVAQLPLQLQRELISGMQMDSALNMDGLLDEFSQRYAWTREDAEDRIRNFWWAMRDRVSGGDIRHLMGQLPKDMQSVFPGVIH